MIPNITRGGRMLGLMAYLAGPGRAGNEVHIDPRLVAGDPATMVFSGRGRLDRQSALRVGRQLDHPRVAFGAAVTTAVKGSDGVPRVDEQGVAVRRDAHVWHCSLSLPAEDGTLSDEKWAAIAGELVETMGFAGAEGGAPCRWAALRHGPSKSGNDHVHVVVGLVHEDGTPAKTFRDRVTAQAACGALERKHGLTVLASREQGTGVRGEKPAERERAERAGDPETGQQRLARAVRAAAAAATGEADFVRRARAAGVLVRPRYATGSDERVVGYSAALRPSGPRQAGGASDPRPAPVWYGGGRLGRDLTLPRLRAQWPGTPTAAAAASAEWRPAGRRAPVSAGNEPVPLDPALWERCAAELAARREQLRSVPLEDRGQWAQVASETAGALAAWSERVEGGTPGPLAEASRALARSAQLRAGQVRPRPAGRSSASGAALLLSSVARGGTGTVAQAVLLRQLARTIQALHDAHRAAGDARRADELRAVVFEQLKAVSARLPQPPRIDVVVDAQAAEAARVARQGQLPARASRPSAPATPPSARPPARRPGVPGPERGGFER